ncbi:secreted RxLR effector protein 161-like [Rutidosis leptorrhynchoides]|uniref:secreted RxLR effector protein 161-like n=1 Tax=Rutidosis leptorrhynchoides TaxID=125765 RepID=UPI003A99D2AF
MGFKRCPQEQAVGNEDHVKDFKMKMKNVFDMSDLGMLSYYLGIEKILYEAGLAECNPTQYPMESRLRLTKDESRTPTDATKYRCLIGSLRYLVNSRPDLSYSVGVMSRFMEEPKESHYKALKCILRYSDSSHGMDLIDRKGTTRMVFYYSGNLITWNSSKQGTVALSSCEAEFMATTSAACQALWLKNLLVDLTG